MEFCKIFIDLYYFVTLRASRLLLSTETVQPFPTPIAVVIL